MSRIINFWSLSFCPPSCFLSTTEILFSNLYFMSWVVSPLFFDMLLKILTPWSFLLVFCFYRNALWVVFHGEHRAVDDMVSSSYLGKRKYFKMCFIKMFSFYLLLCFCYLKSEKKNKKIGKIIILVFTNHILHNIFSNGFCKKKICIFNHLSNYLIIVTSNTLFIRKLHPHIFL